VITIATAQLQSAAAEEMPPPSQLTSRGAIAWQATEDYKAAIDSCYIGKPGAAPQGPHFRACLKRLIRREAASLEAAYSATMSSLQSIPSQTERLRQSQRSWLQFQTANCEFAKAISGNENADESYHDCVLRSTIDRRVELRSLVGD
jgi:uncharacterized protein YecT (DUF1311 family)